MDKNDFVEIADKYASQTANEEEVKAMETFFEHSTSNTHVHIEHEEEVQQRIRKKIGERMGEKPRAFFAGLHPVFRYAAVLLLPLLLASLLGMFLLGGTFGADEIVHATARGEQQELVLPDGSKVMLNNESRLTYTKHFLDNRELQLDGEAFFEVVRNTQKPFVVKSHDLQITVLGTSFNIKSYAQENSYVTVRTGQVKVELNADKKKQVFLTANEQARFAVQAQTLGKQQVVANDFLAWRERTIRFDKMPLSEVVNVLGRWYNVDIQLKNPALENCAISGKYKEDELENVLEGIRFIIDGEYKFIQPTQIVIDGKGCW